MSQLIEFDRMKFLCKIRSCKSAMHKPNCDSKFVLNYCSMVQGVLSYVKRNPGFKFSVIETTWHEINSFARELAKDPQCQTRGPSDPNQDIVKCVKLVSTVEQSIKFSTVNVLKLKKDHKFKKDLLKIKRNAGVVVTCAEHGLVFRTYDSFHYHLTTHHPETWLDNSNSDSNVQTEVSSNEIQ